jgi:hypothetical protein
MISIYDIEHVNHPLFDNTDPSTRRAIVLLGIIEYRMSELRRLREELLNLCEKLYLNETPASP